MDIARPLCGFCGAADRPLQCLARGGDLHSVCQVCFLSQEIARLSASLESSSATLELATEGLHVLYQAVREEVAISQDATEGESGAQGSREGRRQGLRQGRRQGRG